MILSDFSVKHPAIITILLVTVLVFGGLALSSLKSEMIPPVSMPALSVLTVYPGASAAEVERDVSRVIENQLSTMPGMSSLSSSSSPSYSVVSVEFAATVDARAMQPQVRELLNAVRAELPDGIEGEPVIHVYEASAFLPVFSVRIEGTMPMEELTDWLGERLSPALARIEGVSRINLVGGVEKQVSLRLDTDAMASRGMAALQILEALRYSNRNTPAGTARWRDSDISFTTLGAVTSIEELGSTPVGSAGSQIVYLRDVAEIALEVERSDLIVRSAGQNYLMVDLMKRDEGDTVRIAREARLVLDDMVAKTGGAIQYAVVSDQSETTLRSLSTVLGSALTGLLLTVLIILLSLHDLRATLIISLSIPLSMLFAILGLYLTGRSLNLLTLSGLTVAIGMIVDNSIVVLENTWLKFSGGMDRKRAAREGAGELGGAVLASTTTSICVFAPLLFLTGMIGIIMNDLSLTIVFTLASSALVAVVLVPWLSSLILKREELRHRPRVFVVIQGGIDFVFAAIERGYRAVLAAALSHKLFTIAVSVSLFISGVILLSVLKLSFLPPTDTGEFEIHIDTPLGYSLEETLAKVDEIDALVLRLVPEIETAVYYVGSSSASALTTTPNRAFARVRLVESALRERTVQELIPFLQDALARGVSDCDVTILNGGFDALLAMGTGGQGFRMELYGSSLDEVARTADMARAFLEEHPNVFKTELSVRTDSRELLIDLSQSWMASLGVTPWEAGLTSRILFSGMDVGRLRTTDGGDFPVRLVSDFADRPLDAGSLADMALRTRDGRYISFASFSSLSSRGSLSRIERKDRNFSIMLTGYLRNEDQSAVTAYMEEAMASLSLPAGAGYRTAGTSALIGDSMTSLFLVLAIAVFLVYAVMVIQFERFFQPLIIMSAIPFCLVGVVLGLYLFGSALSIIAMLALITLGGTVVNNAIVLIDAVNQARRRKPQDGVAISEGVGIETPSSLRRAILDASSRRLRPILMTAMTTLFGVLPMALARGNGSEIYAPLGQAVFGGLLSSTLITLVFIPVAYEALEALSLAKLTRNREQRSSHDPD